MFPNFTSLAQREQKRQDFLERVQRRLRQAEAKRQMYEDASWASDATKGVSLTSKSSSDASAQTEDDSKKSQISENSQKNPELSTAEIGTQAGSETSDVGSQTRHNTMDKNVQASPRTTEIGTDAEHPVMVDSATSTAPDEELFSDITGDTQQIAKEEVMKFLEKYPELVEKRLHPIGRDGKSLTKYFIGRDAQIYSANSGRKVVVSHIDWLDTYVYLKVYLSKGDERGPDTKSEGDVRISRSETIGPSSETSFSPHQSEEAHEWIKALYKENPNWIALKIHPIKAYGSIDTKRYLGKSGKLFKYGTNRRSKSKFIDWLATRREVEEILYSGESNTIDEVDAMRGEDKDHRYSNFPKKRVAENQIHSETKLPAVAIWEHDSSTDTMSDEKRAKAAVQMMISGYAKKFKGSYITVIPVLKDGTELKDAEVFIDMKGLLNVKNHTGNPLPAKLRDMSWLLTLERFMVVIETKGITIEFKPEETNSLTVDPTRFQTTTGFWLKGKSTGDHSDIHLPSMSMAASDAKMILIDYFHAANREGNVFPIHLIPVKSDGTRDKNGRFFYWFNNDKKGIDELRMMTQLGDISSPKNSKDFFKKIYWVKTLEKLSDSMEDLEKTKSLQSVPEDDKKLIDNALTLFAYVLQQRDHKYKEVSADVELKGRGKLKGRGLRGAGVAPLDGVARRGRTYNLNEIQGLATPSAYTYKQLGSKYIRIPDLDAKTLVIVQPNRRKCGPKRGISDQLQAVIRTLAFKQQIDQSAYDKLNIDDKKLFKEILAITHLQYNFHDRLQDPLDTLRAEYDKLKGELELGNDNPSIIKQLKSLSVDMYSNRLISDSEFKDIIVRLI